MSFFDVFNNFFNKSKQVVVDNKSSLQPTQVVTSQPITPPLIDILLDLMKVEFLESPNKSERKDEIRGIVLHHTGPGSIKAIVNWLRDPAAKAAAHYVVGTGAELIQLVNTSKAAWHAGTSSALLDGKVRDNLNNCTIGIEICNVGVLTKDQNGKFHYEDGRNTVEWKGTTPIVGKIIYPSGHELVGYFPPYPQIQIDKVVELCKSLIAKYPQIGKEDILTHYGIATPEGRKNDPFGLDIEMIKNKIFS